MEVKFKRPWRGHPLGRKIVVADHDPEALECERAAELIAGGYCEEIVKNATVSDDKSVERPARKPRGRKAASSDRSRGPGQRDPGNVEGVG